MWGQGKAEQRKGVLESFRRPWILRPLEDSLFKLPKVYWDTRVKGRRRNFGNSVPLLNLYHRESNTHYCRHTWQAQRLKWHEQTWQCSDTLFGTINVWSAHIDLNTYKPQLEMSRLTCVCALLNLVVVFGAWVIIGKTVLGYCPHRNFWRWMFFWPDDQLDYLQWQV